MMSANSKHNVTNNDIISERSSKVASLYTPIDNSNNNILNSNSKNKNNNILNSNNKKNIFTSNLPYTMMEFTTNNEMTHETQVIWGTDINVFEIHRKLKGFFSHYKVSSIGEYIPDDNNIINSDFKYLYYEKFEEIYNSKIFFLTINGIELCNYDKNIYSQLINFPSDIIPIMDSAANDSYNEWFHAIYPDKENINSKNEITVKITNLKNSSRMRSLGPEDIEKLVKITGIVIRTSEIIPQMREAVFKCSICNKLEHCENEKNNIIEPIECKVCKSKYSFEIQHNRCTFIDKQHVKLQETPEHMPQGETPLTLHLCTYMDLVDEVKPGDRVEVIGVFKLQSLKINPRIRAIKSIFKNYIDVIYFKKNSKTRLNGDNMNSNNIKELLENNQESIEKNSNTNIETDENVFSYNQKLKEIEKLSSDKYIYQKLTDAFAPSIWENEDVKKGLLLQLFSGVTKDFTSYGRGRFRGDINVLLVGDPSTAKSQLLQYIHNIAPRGIYTSGKGSSVVGLTAYVSKDPETKDTILESGALVLSDKGICCIDEFDKMDDDTRIVLHEAMEQQTISIAKAGIICTLNARTSILASANPVHSKYNPKLSVVRNIRLPPSLLTRFDLIYIMLDKPNEISDRKLASHLIGIYSEKDDEFEEGEKKLISRDILTSYISLAKQINPILTKEEYNDMRNKISDKNIISATPRQLESLIRLSEARARLRFSKYVEKEDVDEAVRLIKVATLQAATDPKTGLIDMDCLGACISGTSRKNIEEIIVILKIILRDHKDQIKKGVNFGSVAEEVKKKIKEQNKIEYNESELLDSLKAMENEGILSLYGHKQNPKIKLINSNI